MKNKTKHLIIHIGTEKTGTTSIQDTLYTNYEILKSRNILYPRAFKMQNHVGFCVAFQESVSELNSVVKSGIDEASIAKYRNKLLHDIEKEVESAKCSKIIISNEHLHSRIIKEEEIKKIYLWASSLFDKITIVCYLRKQSDLAVSHYSTQIKSGGIPSQILPDISQGLPHYYDYKKLLTMWSKYFDDIVCKEFSKKSLLNGNVVEDFLSNFDVKINEIQVTKEKNKSLDGKALIFLSLINNKIPLIIDGELNPERKHLIRFFEQMPVRSKIEPSAQEINEFQLFFREDNDYIAKKYFGKEHIFEATSGVKPKDSEKIILSLEDSAEIFTEVWHGVSKYIRFLENRNSLLEKQLGDKA